MNSYSGIPTPYANNECGEKIFRTQKIRRNKLNQLLQDSWAALADKYYAIQRGQYLTTHLYMLKRGGEILENPMVKILRIGNADIVYTDCIHIKSIYGFGALASFSECRRASRSLWW
jgi:exonuclease SbcD